MKFDISLASRSRKSAREHKNIIVMTYFKALTVTFLHAKWHLMFLSLNVRGEPSAEQILAEANWKHEWIVRRADIHVDWVRGRANCTIFILISTTSIIQWGPGFKTATKKYEKELLLSLFPVCPIPSSSQFRRTKRAKRRGKRISATPRTQGR